MKTSAAEPTSETSRQRLTVLKGKGKIIEATDEAVVTLMRVLYRGRWA